MKPIRYMDTIQIEVTNFCHKKCSNCTRLIGHHKKPYFMDIELFKKAVDSLDEFTNMVGVMGGEPLLHPQFEELSLYLHEKVPFERCGLWSSFPEGKEHYNGIIAEVYGNIFLNDHTRNDILHGPVLVASDEVVSDKTDLWCMVESCWVQQSWSASINPNGAYFCEIAAALGMLFNIKGWELEKNWWLRAPIDYVDQMRTFCLKCGCAMPLMKRFSVDEVDDISPKMYEQLKDISPKIKSGNINIHNLEMVIDRRPIAAYKDDKYRKAIAKRYDLILMYNKHGYMVPFKKVIGVDKNV